MLHDNWLTLKRRYAPSNGLIPARLFSQRRKRNGCIETASPSIPYIRGSLHFLTSKRTFLSFYFFSHSHPHPFPGVCPTVVLKKERIISGPPSNTPKNDPSPGLMDNSTDPSFSSVMAPLKAVSATDQGGIVAITASLGLVFGAVSLLIRAYVRIECRASFGRDDYAAFASMLVAVLQAVLVFLAIGRGFGEAASVSADAASMAWQRSLYASDVFFVVGMWLTKSSIALLLMRLSRDPVHAVIARVLLAASGVYALVSVFVVTLRCDLSQPWNLDADGCATSTVSLSLSLCVSLAQLSRYLSDAPSTPAGRPSPSWTP